MPTNKIKHTTETTQGNNIGAITHSWDKLPLDLRQYDQWCIAAPDKSPWFVSDNKWKRASSTNRSTWMSFDDAKKNALLWDAGIGFMLSEDDPFACIDLDDKDGTTDEERAGFKAGIESFDSYTERSRSGKGYHIWVKGNVGRGRKRQHIELYDRARFIICTSNIVRDRPIEDRSDMVEKLAVSLGVLETTVQGAPVNMNVAHNPKVIAWAQGAESWTGRAWRGELPQKPDAKLQITYYDPEVGDASQSASDLLLVKILMRKTASDDECWATFRQSALGKRDKAKRPDYARRTLNHARQAIEQDAEKARHGNELAAQLLGTHVEPVAATQTTNTGQTPAQPEPARGSADISGIMQQAARVVQDQANEEVQLRYASQNDIVSASIEYLMEPFLPAKCVVGFYGRGSSAKSSFLATICANISTYASSLWVSTEEPDDWIRVRHIKAGGVEGSLAVVEATTKKDQNGRKVATNFNVYEHLEPAITNSNRKQRENSRPETKMVVLDTAVALTTWGQKENPNDDASVKRLLTFLRSLCERYGVTICIIGHSNKSTREHLSDQVMGAAAWTNTPRLSFIHAKDIHGDYKYVLRVAKSNFNVFGMPYSTAPVHTLHKSSLGPDTVLVKVNMNHNDIVWGEVESREMFDQATKKQTEEQDGEGFNVGTPKHIQVAQRIQQMLSQQSTNTGITRDEVESEMGEKLYRSIWTKVDEYIQKKFAETINIERGDKNKIIYKAGLGLRMQS